MEQKEVWKEFSCECGYVGFRTNDNNICKCGKKGLLKILEKIEKGEKGR